MKPYLLSILPRPPHPTTTGSAIRDFHLLSALADQFRVHAVVLTEPGARSAYPPGVSAEEVAGRPTRVRRAAALARSLAGRDAYPRLLYASRRLEERASAAAARERPAWCIAHEYHVGPFALESGAPAWIDFHNVDSEIWAGVAATSSSPARRFLAARQVPRVRAFERGLVAGAEGVSGVSAHDVEVLAALDPPRPPLLVPNGVDLERYAFRAAPAPAETLFFVGDLSWAPNAEGMAWFQKRVWPVLRRLVPAARARVMGRGAGPRLRRGAPAGVEYVGEGADTRGEWREAAASFVPLRAGGGTRLKILEAAACGVPVVSTSVGAAGLAFEPEEEILLRDEPEGFAEALAGLLRDPDRRRRQASAARARVEREYGWRAIGERFAAELLRRRGDA